MTDVASRTDRRAEQEAELEGFRTELTGYCYRMLGSAFDADDAVQETMVRAWRALDGFDGRSSLRTWLYRIATNVCLDSLKGRNRRALPVDVEAGRGTPDAPLAAPMADASWVEPFPDARALAPADDPAEAAAARESVRLAFVAALQHLPPRQRAVVILREVLRWRATEVAQLLGTTVASVNSALQRGRATLAARQATSAGAGAAEIAALDGEQQALLARYVDAFERFDIDAFVALLHEDATQSMPPWALWLQGPDHVAAWMRGPGAACRGSRLVPIALNGRPGFAQYRPGPGPEPGGPLLPFALHLPTVTDGRVADLTFFLDTRLFGRFGLPASLDA